MKTIDLLVKELPEKCGWPVGADSCRQDGFGIVTFYNKCQQPIRDVRLAAIGSNMDISNRLSFSCFIKKNEYEAALAASKQPAWSGEGLPPVGVTCEHCPGGTTQTEWEVVTVLGVSERPGGVFTDYWLRKEDGSTYIIGNPYRFRPIRTEAERRRESICDAIYGALTKAEREHNRSDEAEALYDAISAGKIPGVKLED